MNKYTGEVPLQIGDIKGTLEYNWRALAEVTSEFSKDRLDNVFSLPIADLTKIAAIGFKKHTPQITADTILDSSPAVAKVAKAVDDALVLAYHGPEEGRQLIKAVEEMNKELNKNKARAAVAADSKKKTR